MDKNLYIAPKFRKTSFHCPHCSVCATHEWTKLVAPHEIKFRAVDTGYVWMSQCTNDKCAKATLWVNREMVYPRSPNIPPVCEGVPDDVKEYYKEAQGVISVSPRAAAGLLRLALEAVCKDKDCKRVEDLLSKTMLSDEAKDTIKERMKSIRITGNHAVHVGVINFNDNRALVEALLSFMQQMFLIVYGVPSADEETVALVNKLTKKTKKVT